MGKNFLEKAQEPTCYGCKYLIDIFGNYVECGKMAENGVHMFVDWFYWNTGSPKECPLRKRGFPEGFFEKPRPEATEESDEETYVRLSKEHITFVDEEAEKIGMIL